MIPPAPIWTANTCLVSHVTDGADFTTVVSSSQPGEHAAFRCRRTGDQLRLESDGIARSVCVNLRAFSAPDHLSNGKLRTDADGHRMIVWTDSAKPLILTVAQASG
jgi:hypothetical protein